MKAEVAAAAEALSELEVKEEELKAEIRKRMLVIPNIIDDSVPIGKDDSENVEIERFGEPAVCLGTKRKRAVPLPHLS